MKRFLLCLIFISGLAACKKDHQATTIDKTLHKVSFTLGFSARTAAFGATVNKLKTNTTVLLPPADTTFAANPQLTTIYYAIYDAAGNGVHIIKQLSTDAGFGHYTDNLASGTYTVVVAAGGDYFSLGKGANTASKLSTDIISYLDPNVPTRNTTFFGDAVYKKISITVSGSNINQQVVLERITSKLVVNISDALPANAVSLNLFNMLSSDTFNVGTGTYGTSASHATAVTIPTSARGTTNYQYSTFILPGTAAFTLRLFCSARAAYTSEGTSLGEALIPVTVLPNTQTILTGNLFGDGTGSGFAAKIDTTWDSTPITKSF